MDLEATRHLLEGITREIELLCGLESRWNGSLYLTDEIDVFGNPRYWGKKSWDCGITIHHASASDKGLFNTLVHESFHAVSAGVTPNALLEWRGYEEGVVEWATRQYAPRLADEFGVATPAARFAFQRYVDSLDQLRSATSRDEEPFYLGLLAVPLAGRENGVLEWIMEADPTTSLALTYVRWADQLRNLRK